ncbi:jg1458, partial [Pararge aegeria aegeria]
MAGQLIVDEFLCFVQNKIDVLDELSVIQICATNFTDVEVETGKSTLYGLCSDGLRNIQRKGDDKKKKCIKDVIKLLKEVDPNSLPIFVARDLGRLPPVSFDYVDVTRLLKDMSSMKAELMTLKAHFSSELLEIRTACQSCKSGDNKALQISVTPKNVQSMTPSKTLPPVPLAARIDECSADSLQSPTYRDVVFRTDRQAKSARMQRVTSGQSGLTPTVTAASDAASVNVLLPSEDKNEPYTLVVNKKRKLKNMRGTSITNCKIQVADSQCSIYVSRAKKSVTVDDMLEHIADMGEQCISIEQLKQFNETSFNSFKVTIS